VQGWVKRENAASLRVFRALGFDETRADRGGELCHLFQRHIT
jgi:L-amino acid N-acyltransferase YncA